MKTINRKAIYGMLAFGLLVSFMGCNKKAETKEQNDVAKNSEEVSVDEMEKLLAKMSEQLAALTANEENQSDEANSFKAHESKHANYKFSYSATSYLVETLSSGTTSYSPDNLGTKIGTPWVPKNVNGKNGIGEKVILYGDWDNHLCLALRNGFQSARVDDIYQMNSRAKTFNISCFESGKSMTVTVYDTTDTQVIDIREILPASEVPSLTINMEIVEAYNGSKFSDLCIDSIVPYFYDGSAGEKVRIVRDLEAEANSEVDKAANANNWMWKCKLYLPAGVEGPRNLTLEKLYSGLSENTVFESDVDGNTISVTTSLGAKNMTLMTLTAGYECNRTDKTFVITGFTLDTIAGSESKTVYDLEDYGYCFGFIQGTLEQYFYKK